MKMIRFVFALLVVVGTAGAALADDAGKTLFVHYCSSCHGTDGKGNGPLAEVLEIEPADLTQLAKKNGGELSFLELMQAIDGRKRVRGHGETGMPVWGEVFQAPKTAPVGEQLQGAGKLLLITYHVESIQEK